MCNPRSGNGVFLSDISRPSRCVGVYTNSQNTPVQKHNHNCDLTCQLLWEIRMRPAGNAVYYLDRLVGGSGVGPRFLSRQTPFHYFLDRTHWEGLNKSCLNQNRDKAPDRQIIPVMELDCIRVWEFFHEGESTENSSVLISRSCVVHCKAEDPFHAKFCEVRFCTTL